jgi:hypothetical protein
LYGSEEELYPEIRNWLNNYLNEKYGGNKWSIMVSEDSHKHFIEDALRRMGVNKGLFLRLKIKVDIVALLRKGDREELILMEVKLPPTSLKDLGQLWGYTQLLNPLESFLISPNGTGTLNELYHVMNRDDLFIYGLKGERRMVVGRWDSVRKNLDQTSIIPNGVL